MIIFGIHSADWVAIFGVLVLVLISFNDQRYRARHGMLRG